MHQEYGAEKFSVLIHKDNHMTRQGFMLTSDSAAGGDDDLVLGRFTFLIPL